MGREVRRKEAKAAQDELIHEPVAEQALDQAKAGSRKSPAPSARANDRVAPMTTVATPFTKMSSRSLISFGAQSGPAAPK